MSIKQVSKRYDIPRSTLTRHVKQIVSGDCQLGRFRPVFHSHMESELSKHLTEMQQRFYGLMPSDFRKLAFEYAETLKIDHHLTANQK